ncbi:hypothetical protein Scel_23110 [Streptomyces cellostaticus]|nr:hypothetical protein Scel_23110 [Streptomyces cellostaticus]
MADTSRERGASRLYRTTQQDNTTARALYDKVAGSPARLPGHRSPDPADCGCGGTAWQSA